jgi:nucleoside-diphosphate-sugar epimerase
MATCDNFDRYRGVPAMILGATGFVGRWVARELATHGAELLLVARDTSALERIAAEYRFTGRIWCADLSDPALIAGLVRGLRPGVVFNLAGYGVDRSERDEAESETLNIGLVETLLETLHTHRGSNWSGQALVHTGSALEYGMNGGRLAEDAPAVPHTLYGRHKLAATERIAAFAARHALPAVTARLFTVYGPGEHAGRLLPTLLDAMRGADVQLSPGRQKRDFTYIGDVAEGLCRLGIAGCRPGEVVNLATGRLTTVRDFVEIACDSLAIRPQRLDFGAIGTRPDEMPHESVSIERLRQLTGWTPPHSIADGVKKTAQFLDCRDTKAMADAIGGPS